VAELAAQSNEQLPAKQELEAHPEQHLRRQQLELQELHQQRQELLRLQQQRQELMEQRQQRAKQDQQEQQTAYMSLQARLNPQLQANPTGVGLSLGPAGVESNQAHTTVTDIPG
jgi:hypothetical protein